MIHSNNKKQKTMTYQKEKTKPEKMLIERNKEEEKIQRNPI